MVYINLTCWIYCHEAAAQEMNEDLKYLEEEVEIQSGVSPRFVSGSVKQRCIW